jgi:kynureninase
VKDIEFQPGKDFAVAMDDRDPLRNYQERFLLPKHAGSDCVYLCGHSLGLQPKTTATYIQQELIDWA